MVLLLWSALAGAVPAENLKWRSSDGQRSAPLQVPPTGKAGFARMEPQSTGLAFTNQLSQSRSLTNQIFLNGSGVAAGDVDGDGWCDLYFCGLDNPNELYRNRGNWTFERITAKAGVACAGQASTGAALADFNGDGYLDLAVNGVASGTRLFINDGQAHFTEATAAWGLDVRTGSTSLAIADVNGDGFLDLYVVNYRNSTFRDEPEKRFRVENRAGKYELLTVDGRPVSDPDLVGRFVVDPVTGLLEQGEADALYMNERGLRFRKVDWTDGTFADENGRPVGVPYDWGLSAMFRDLNGDSAPDLYVCNDFQSPDRIWINDGRGKFRSARADAFRQTSLFSMGLDFADLDGDGREEIFVADMLSRKQRRRHTQLMNAAGAPSGNLKFDARPQTSRNTLFWNRGDGRYAEVAQLAGLDASEWSWCPVFLDVDLDARPDLLVTTGHERDAQDIDVALMLERARTEGRTWREQIELRRKFPRLESPILAFRNEGNLSFSEATADWGFMSLQISQGIALADLDNDGDQDLAVNCLNSSALLYRNETAAPRLAIRLLGTGANKAAIGAKISVVVNGLPAQRDEVVGGGRYLSSDDYTKTFATRDGAAANIQVTWPDAKVTQITNAQANTLYEIAQAGATAQTIAAQLVSPSFEDVSAQLQNHIHRDTPFDDFQREPLLPRKFSELSPGVSWFDLEGDGWEDLLVGSGRGGALGYFRNDRGRLARGTLAQMSAATRRDQGAVLGWMQGTNRSLLITFSTYEEAQPAGPALIQYHPHSQTLESLLPAGPAAIGALALGDTDGDGDLDLFVGGRIVPGRYPAPASSVFLRNEGGSLRIDAKLNHALENIGLVSAATWSDLTQDGRPELLLAIDGGPIRVFTFANEFREITGELGLEPHLGWWLSISTGDFNNDGRMDIIAGNLGRNSKYERFVKDGYALFYSKSAELGSTLLLEAIHDRDSSKLVPIMDRDSLARTLPDLPSRYRTFAAFSTAGVLQILGDRASTAGVLHVNTTESMLFLNDGPGRPFRPQALPLLAQFAPVFGLAVGDVNADGNEDLVLAQNLFAVGKRTSRYDAGEGSLLLGDGQGQFSPQPGATSGIKLAGEGRGVAFCDFDHDGRLDLAAGQNSAETKLYRNRTPARGLRILLHADQDNPYAIGAQIRLRYSTGSFGPAHEIRAGDGHWSQAGSTPVLGKKGPVQAVEVIWPGGHREEFLLADEADEITIRKGASRSGRKPILQE